ncbi:hypothetical protein LB504_001140, partial [Fusarium proliferatum]
MVLVGWEVPKTGRERCSMFVQSQSMMNVMKTRVSDPDGLLEELEVETSPGQIGDTQASNSVKNTDNLYESGRLRGIM